MRHLYISVVLTTFCVPSHADDSPQEMLSALTSAAVSEVLRGNMSAVEQLNLLMAMPEPWRALVLRELEQSALLSHKPWDFRSPDFAAALARLTETMANAQGANSLPSLSPLPVYAQFFEADLETVDTRWFYFDARTEAPRELLFESAECTPDIAAFVAPVRLPDRPGVAIARYSASMASVDATQPIAIRIRGGNCEAQNVPLRVTSVPARANVDESARTLDVERVSVIALHRDRIFSLPTSAGMLYDVYAAPLSREIDPVLMHLDPSDPVQPDMIDDDGGWQLGSTLSGILGTGKPQGIVVTRASEAIGDVALLARARPIPTYEGTAFDVPAETPVWVKVHIPTGTWSLRTEDLSDGFDPALEVIDGNGKSLGSSDDRDDEDLRAEVALSLSQATDVVVRTSSANGEPGSARLVLHAEVAEGPIS